MPRPVGVASQSPPQAHAPHHHPLLDERPPGCQLFAAATAPVVFLGRGGVPALTRPSGAPCGRGVGVRRLALSPARAPARPAVPAPRLTFLTRRRGAAEVQLRCGAGHGPARPFARPSREASCSAEPAHVGVTSKGGRRAPRPAVGCPRGAFFVVVLLKCRQHRRAVRDARLSRGFRRPPFAAGPPVGRGGRVGADTRPGWPRTWGVSVRFPPRNTTRVAA